MSSDNYFNNLESPLKEIAIELRSIIRKSSEHFREDIKWNVPTYSINANICSIMAHKKHVNLQIFRGAHIKYVNKLEGTGKDMRHLKFTARKNINRKEIVEILAQAIDLDK